MNYLKKNLPIFLLSGSLIFAGFSFSPSAQGATATISSLQKEIRVLQKETQSLKSCQKAFITQIAEAWNGNYTTGWLYSRLKDIRC